MRESERLRGGRHDAPTRSEPQNLTSGMSAKGSCKERITEETTMRYSAYSSPAMIVTRREGMMAAERVRNARNTGLI